jgi:GTPase SAR1 family protein
MIPSFLDLFNECLRSLVVDWNCGATKLNLDERRQPKKQRIKMSMLLVHELHEARDRILVLRQILSEAIAVELPAYRGALTDQIGLLDEALDQARIPDHYRVAVVGRFKVGKSSFVNKLAGERLAGVDTNPETAAISVFRYDDEARAEVELVSTDEWGRLREEFEDDPKNPALKRYERFIHFNDRPPTKEGDADASKRESADLDNLIKQWVVPGGKTHRIESKGWEERSGKTHFLKEIKKFTSSREPLHYLVNKLTIYAPIPILRDNIELIDTPGLDDTERFRVVLTENLVKEVDAILFLTISGASYSDGDKEFIVRQLRQRQLKHLQIIVTKCDETFENALRDAEEADDVPPTFEQFREKEIARVRAEVSATLQELLQSNQMDDEAGYYYIEQLDSVPIHLISTKYHDQGEGENGGIEGVRNGLYQVLSKSHRFEYSRNILCLQLDRVLERLKRSFAERRDTLEAEFDLTKVEHEIKAIRGSLANQLEAFERQLGESLGLLQTDEEAVFATVPLHLDLMISHAKEVLSDLEKADLGKHWRARRNKKWGELEDLQSKIADRIFPSAEAILNKLRANLELFMETASSRLTILQSNLENVESQHKLTGLEPLSLSDLHAPRLGNLRSEFATMAENERDAIVSNLDDFVTKEVEERLEVARSNVREITGNGTTDNQARSVSKFYSDVRQLLTEALRAHLEARLREFATAITKSAQSVAPHIRQTSENAIDQRLDAIKSAMEVAATGKKGEVSDYLTRMLGVVDNFGANPEAVKVVRRGFATNQNISTNSSVNDETDDGIESNSEPVVTHGTSTTEVVGEVKNARVPEDALQEQHYQIPEGATGYTYERIFCPYLETAAEITVEDPFIAQRHQIDNFTRFCALAIRLGNVKQIELITKDNGYGNDDEADGQLESLRRDLAARDVRFEWKRSRTIHDREIRLDSGWVIKIGRGLDIYQKPISWRSVSAADYSLRECKETRVDIMRIK